MEEKKRLTVRQLIEHLQTLDPDKGIWIAYDFPCALLLPIPDETADESYPEFFPREEVEVGDYVITAG